MNQPEIHMALDVEPRLYLPGEELSGRFHVDHIQSVAVRSAELSVLWHTVGKGEEDLAVHHFERLAPALGERLDLRTPRHFATRLPLTPLSYDGVIVKIAWCVRLRVFLERGREVASELPFRLGQVSTREYFS